MTTKKEIVSRLLFENTGLICGYQTDDEVEEYYESLTDPKKISTIDFVNNVNVEVQKAYIKQLREQRNELIKKTDFLTVSDFPFPSSEIRTAWLNYRQALRDLPATQSTPQMNEKTEFVFTWPTPPIWPPNVV